MQYPGFQAFLLVKLSLFGKIGMLFLSIFICLSSVQAQFFSVYDIDASNYPLLRAKYLCVDESGEQVYKMDRRLLEIFENDHPAEIVALQNPKRTSPKRLSVVLVFDVSSSMDHNRLEIARAAGMRFIELLPLEVSECAVSSFDHMNYLNVDFTHSEERLKKAIHALKPRGGTNYNSGFIRPYSGAFQVLRKGKYKKVVVFLTDGRGEGDKQEIIRRAQKLGISVYPVTIDLQMPEILKEVAVNTGGQYFGQVTDTAEARKVYNQILLAAQSVEPGTVTWRSPGSCRQNIHTHFSYMGHSVEFSYRLTKEQLVKLDINPLFIQFDSVNSDQAVNIDISAINSGFTIQDIVVEQAESFSLRPPRPIPFRVKRGSTARIRVSHDKAGKRGAFTPITIVNDLCPDYYVYAKGGKGEVSGGLELVTPNGGEIYSAGMKEPIVWKGIASRDSVSVFHSFNSGETWSPVGVVSGLTDEWEIPAVTGNNNLVRIEQGRTGTKQTGITFMIEPGSEPYKAHNAKFVGSGQYIMTAEDDHSLKLWDANTGRYIRSFRHHSDWVYDAVGGPDGKKVVSASDDGSAMVFSLNNDTEPQKLSVNYSGINKAIFSNDGRDIITAGDDGSVRIWNAKTGDHKYGILAHSGWVLDVDQSPDGSILVSGGDDGMIRTFKYDAGSFGSAVHRKTLTGHRGWVLDVEFSPGGRTILSASKDGTVRLWDAQSGTLLHAFRQHSGGVYSATFSPDGEQILTASHDGRVLLWDVAGKKVIDQIKAPGGDWFRRAYFGPRGDRIITISNTREVKVWVVNQPDPFQKDLSDETFRIVSPKPLIKSVDFGELEVGGTMDTLIKEFYHNPTDHPIKILHTFIGGKDKRGFSMVSGFQPFILYPGQFRDVELNYAPRFAGKRTGYLGVVTPTDTVAAGLRGNGFRKGYAVPVERIDMGKVKLYQSRDTSFVLIENTGSKQLHINNWRIEGPGEAHFSLKKPQQVTNIPPGGTKKVSLTFQPKQRGRINGTLVFRAGNQLHEVQLYGEGLAPARVHVGGKVLSKESHEPLVAEVTCYDLETNRRLRKVQSKESGSYVMTLNADRRYRIVADRSGYMPASVHVDLTDPIIDESMEQNIYLSSIDSGSTMVLNNIFFEFAKARLTEESKAELNRMSRFLKENPGISVQISGHTDSIGSRQSNLTLSRRRAESVRDYLTATGISSGRITTKGFGEIKPVADNETEEGRRKNRRVEFTITGHIDLAH